MKNIHVLPTENYSPLVHSTNKHGGYFKSAHYSPMKEMGDSYQHIYITSDEEITGFENNIWVIKGDRIFLWQNTMALVSNNKPKKIILTTDQDLINDGVQAIDDEFLEWFVKNPSCEQVEAEIWTDYRLENNKEVPFKNYKIIIPKEEPKQEQLTAVEWLMTKLQSLGVTKEEHYELLCQLELEAKEMEKEQIENAFNYGQFDLGMEADEYYNETFKSE